MCSRVLLIATSSVCKDDASSVTFRWRLRLSHTKAAPVAPVSYSTEPSVKIVREWISAKGCRWLRFSACIVWWRYSALGFSSQESLMLNSGGLHGSPGVKSGCGLSLPFEQMFPVMLASAKDAAASDLMFSCNRACGQDLQRRGLCLAVCIAVESVPFWQRCWQ